MDQAISQNTKGMNITFVTGTLPAEKVYFRGKAKDTEFALKSRQPRRLSFGAFSLPVRRQYLYSPIR